MGASRHSAFALALGLCLLAAAPPAPAQTHGEALVWGPAGRYGQFSDLAGGWAALSAVDVALRAPADGSTVYVSGGGDALRVAIAAAGSTGTLIEITDSATYNWVTFAGKSRVYVRARAGQSPKIVSDPTTPDPVSGGNSNAVVFSGDNTDIGLQGLTFLVREHGNAESTRQPSKVGALRYSTLAGGTRLQGLLIQDCRFEPFDRTKGAVAAIQLANETGSTLAHRDIGIRRSVFDSTGTVAAATDDLAAVTVSDFENVLVANVHFKRTSTQPTASEMRGARLNVRFGLVEFAYCEDIGGTGQANDCVYVSQRTGGGLGSLDGLSVTVRNSAALSANRAFSVARAGSTLALDHVVVVTSYADQVLRIGEATASMAITNSIFLQLSGSAQLMTNAVNGPLTSAYNLYRWLGPLGFTAGGSDKYPGAPTCDVNCDPKFVNALASDFRMLAGSPAIRAAADGSDMGLLLYSISPAARAFGTSGGTGSVTVTASGPWSASADVAWITPSPVGPVTGDGTINYLVAVNTASSTRTGVYTVAGIQHTVTQAGIACNPSLSPTSQSVAAAGGGGTVTVSQAATDCAWTATSNVPWVTITSGATGTGLNGAVGYAVAPNASSGTRTGTITIAGVTFTITQAGVGCNYSLTPTSVSLPATASTGLTVDLYAAVSDCAWSATSSQPGWLHVTAGASGLGPGTVSYSVDANPNSATRTGTLTVGGQVLTVSQQGVACSQQVSPLSAFVPATAGAGPPVSVTSTADDCSWSSNVSGANPWISITSPNVAQGSKTVTWSVVANGSSQMRTGVVTIAGQTFEVNQAGTACSFVLSAAGTPAPLDAGGGTGSVGVDSSATDCGWTATSQAGWVTITSGASGSGDGAVAFAVAPNASSFGRTGTLSIAGRDYTVSQNGLSCGYAIAPTSATAPTGGGDGTVQLTAAVNDCTWTAAPATGVDWITITSANPSVGSSTVSYAVTPNPRSASRTGALVIAGRTFTVTQPGVACTYTLSASTATAGSTATTNSVRVTTNAPDCTWTITPGASWVGVSGQTTRTGTDTVSYSVAANSLSQPRTTTLTIAGQPFQVTQEGAVCTYSLASTTSTATTVGGTQSVKVTTSATDCAWTNTSNASWITVTSGPSRTGTGDVALTIASNSSSSRTRVGTVAIAGATYTVTQPGIACTLTVAKTASVPASANTLPVDVTASPGDCEWTAASDVAWMTVPAAQQAGTGSGRIDVALAATTTSKPRSGNVTIGANKLAVTQAGLVCAYTLSATAASFDYRAANGTVDVTANATDCQWGTTKSAAWVTLGVTSGTGSKLVTYAVAANPTTVPRQATIQLAGVDHTITQGPAPCAISLASTSGSVTATSATGSFSVTAASAECTWTVSTAAPWITITSPAPVSPGSSAPLTAQGNGSVKFSAAANTSSKPRTATITVSDRTYTVTQAGAACTYTLDPTSVTMPPIGGPKSVAVTASVSDCEWTATTAVDWLVLGSAAGVGSGTVTFSAATNGGTRARTGNVAIGGKNCAVTQTAQGGSGELFTRYMAEGATSQFFSTRLALLNPGTAQANVTLRFLKANGQVVEHQATVKSASRATIDPRAIVGDAEFSIEMESQALVVLDRTMSWDATGFGSHAETGVQFPSTTWYLAEGSTAGGFDLFYLVQNPNAEAAALTVKFLLPGGGTPLTRQYTVPGNTRYNIWVDQIPELVKTDVSAVITADRPVIVERAMYLSRPGITFTGGHESAGVTAPDVEWYLAEGATGAYFDTYVLVANPATDAAEVLVTYLLPGGGVVEKSYTVEALSRFSIWVDQEDPLLADTGVSAIVRSINGVPIIVERAMWWPGNWTTWAEAHNSFGVTGTGTKWALAEGEVGGARNAVTYVLVANTGPTAGQAKVTLYFESGTPVSKTIDLPPTSRTNVDVGALFKEAAGKRFGIVVESLGTAPAPLVVERAMYTDANGVTWAAGTNALATKLQ